jgi:two-component system sensor histidine kinase SenX3
MNFSRRRGAIALSITFGVLLTILAVTLNIAWIVNNKARVAYLVLGIVFFALLVAGVVLNTVFLVREVRRNERQDSFLNAVTHELKTPIASIRLYLETLQRRPLDESQRNKFYAIMHADTDRLIATVEQVLKAGELGQRERHLNRTVLDLYPLVAECVAITLNRHHLEPECITLAPTTGNVKLRVSGIPEDLRTAVLNLLDNAVKYSPPLPGERTALQPRIRCKLAISNYAFVAVSIADEGLGIPERELNRIFKRFYRIPGRYAVKIKGTGLGLFLVRSIAKQHGGTVAAASAGPNQGSTFTLTLPLAS